ncbi:hypothetical protein OF83DRAFT_1089660 [Amylostereum chailletii]|nr:hypothetical protein OF83DRAFT_1089660 [Amylostereum chailletii]
MQSSPFPTSSDTSFSDSNLYPWPPRLELFHVFRRLLVELNKKILDEAIREGITDHFFWPNLSKDTQMYYFGRPIPPSHFIELLLNESMHCDLKNTAIKLWGDVIVNVCGPSRRSHLQHNFTHSWSNWYPGHHYRVNGTLSEALSLTQEQVGASYLAEAEAAWGRILLKVRHFIPPQIWRCMEEEVDVLAKAIWHHHTHLILGKISDEDTDFFSSCGHFAEDPEYCLEVASKELEELEREDLVIREKVERAGWGVQPSTPQMDLLKTFDRLEAEAGSPELELLCMTDNEAEDFMMKDRDLHSSLVRLPVALRERGPFDPRKAEKE